LAKEYPSPEVAHWDTKEWIESSTQLGVERVAWMKRVLGARLRTGTRCLELGAGDASVAGALANTGAEVLAVDIQREVYEDARRHMHVPFLEADVSDLRAVEDDSYDLVYSFDSFEHFPDPAAALSEALRVTRPGGHVYLRFGPLYDCPDGKHLGDRLGIPYAGVLFEDATIDAHMLEQGRDVINHEYCNYWPLDRYRALFAPDPQRFDVVFAYDHLDLSALELISRYPEVFRARAESIDSFLVNVIEILLRKPDASPQP
jgi:SAM-dependent methyltransferase